MILLSNYSCVRVRVKEGASSEDHVEYRKSVRFKVHQGNDVVNRTVEWLQNMLLKVTTRDWIVANDALFMKAVDVHW